MFGAQASSPSFGTPSSTPAFGTPSSSFFGTPSLTPAFGTPSSASAFGTPSTTNYSNAFGSSLFSNAFSQQQKQQQTQQQTSMFQQPSSGGFGFQTPFAAPQSYQFSQPSAFSIPNAQLTTQMAPVAPLPFSLADRDIQAIVDAYKDEAGNPKYAFKHLLFSVTDPQYRVKPANVSDIMWTEAMGKMEGMETSNRERLWPQLVQGFKDLSQRLKLQDEVIQSDSERLHLTQNNVKMLQRHFQGDTLPRIERMKQKELCLQRRLLRVMRIVEALESKGCRIPLMKEEAELADRLAAITRQLKGSGAELRSRVQNLVSLSRSEANSIGGGLSGYHSGSTKIDKQSFNDLQEVLQKQTEAIGRLENVLKRDGRDMKIMMAEGDAN